MNPTLIGMLVMWKFVWDNVALNLLYILLISTKAVKKKKKEYWIETVTVQNNTL